MKHIFQGIFDYCKDCYHDFWYWVWDSLECWCFRRMKNTYDWKENDGCYTKEGSLSHYIRQRKIGNQRRSQR